MRLPIALLLALPAAFLSSLVVAVPSPAAYNLEQQPLSIPSPTFPTRSRWRTLSDRLVRTVWGVPQDRNPKSSNAFKTNSYSPPHALARYGGDVVLRFNISTNDEARSLAEAADTLLLDVWEFSQNWVDIRLAKDIVAPLLGLLPASMQNAHTPLLQERELVKAIHDSYPTPRDEYGPAPRPHHLPSHFKDRPFSPTLERTSGSENLFFADYQPLSVIDPWMSLLASLFTTHVRKISIGISYQGRSIPALRVGVHPTNKKDESVPKRPTVLVTGGLHAREWISISTVNYLAYNFITGYGKIPRVTSLLQEFDFVFIPTLNPDGYVYSWETDRLWRKNRQQTALRFCQGIDLDRSFGFGWDGATTTADNPCSESFAGETPFEAIEAKRLADWARNETEHNNVDFVGFIDLHSYSQEILYPYSYSCDATPPGLENLEELAIGLEKAIRISHGHTYEVLPACQGNVAATSSSSRSKTAPPRLRPRMESSGGSALDFFYHEMHVRYAYQIKLRDRGTYGFLLPKENIVPTGKELWDAMLYFGSFLSVDHEPSLQTAVPDDDMSVPEDVPVVPASASAADEDEDDDDWILIEDLDSDEPNPELRRRRRR